MIENMYLFGEWPNGIDDKRLTERNRSLEWRYAEAVNDW
jgi:hypothetical protein